MAEQVQPFEKVYDDHISELPDAILCFILGFLSIRDAVKTRLLSRRWRSLSSSSSNLHFDILSVTGISLVNCSQEVFLKRKSKFITGVNRFLELYSGPNIDAFKVRFGLGDDSQSHITRWVSFALGSGTKRISLSLTFCPHGAGRCEFPCHLLLSPHHRLKHLRLKSCTLTPPPDYAKRLSCVSTLRLGFVRLDRSHLDNILSGCSNLEWLKLVNCSLPDNLCFSGPSPPLKSLILKHCKGFNTLELNSLQKLISFEYRGRMEELTFVDVPALKSVYFSLWNTRGRGTRYVFNELAEDLVQLRLLSLIFIRFEIPLIPERMTTFRHLKQLELSIYISPNYDLLNIVHVLNASPALQKFKFAYLHISECNVTSAGRLESKTPHLQLEHVEIFGFKGTPNEMDLVSYLLNNCIVLKLLSVNSQRKSNIQAGTWVDSSTFPLLYRNELNCEEIRDKFSQQRHNSGVEIIVS